MTKISLIAIIWVWHCVVYGQLAVSNFHPYNPYNIPHYTSTIISQPTNQNYAEMEAQLLGGTDELGNIPNTRNSPFQGVIFFQIKRHQATMAKLAKQLKDTTDALKATQADLVTTKKAVSDLTTALQTTNTNLAAKAAQADLLTTNQAVSDLKTATNNNLDTKATKTDLAVTNQAVADLKGNKSPAQPSSIGSIPASCGDLQTIGFVNSGIYSILVNKQVQNVYCDFTKSGSADFQKLIGIVDVKSTQVYFYAQMSSPGYSTINTAIPFDVIKFNVGVAYSATGIFVAPTSGIYYFAVTAFTSASFQIDFQTKTAGTTNWITVPGTVESRFSSTLQGPFSSFKLSTLQLNKGDQFRLYLTRGQIYNVDLTFFPIFLGLLIEENELIV